MFSTCEEVQQRLPLFWCSELKPEEEGLLQHHLDSCPHCAREAALQQDYDARLRNACLGDMPDATLVQHRIREKLSSESLPWWRQFFPFRVAAFSPAAAAMVLTIVLLSTGVAWYAFRSSPISLAAASARDHVRCVVNHEHEDWHTEPSDISAFFMHHLGTAQPVNLENLGMHLVRTRICNLAGPRFVHLVLTDEQQREISVYIRQSPDRLIAGDRLDRTGRPSLHYDRVGSFQIASFESDAKTVLLLAPWTASRTAILAERLRAQFS